MGLNERVQEYVQSAYVLPARERGERMVRIKAGDVHRNLHWSNRVPSVCTTLASHKFQKETGLELISKEGPPSGYSTTVVYTYKLSSAPTPTKQHEVKKPSLESLYGILANVFQELGGGEKFLREERKQLDFRKETRSQKEEA